MESKIYFWCDHAWYEGEYITGRKHGQRKFRWTDEDTC